MEKKIRVGIAGVNSDRGWASIAHIPALNALPDFEVSAISNLKEGVAERTAKLLGIPYYFDNNAALIENSNVDLVAVTVRVPQHRELVIQAINAGKNVYCEWPLGNGLEEAEELSILAKKKGIFGAVGLQSRAIPAVNYIKDLIADGYIGEVLSTSLIGSGIIFGEYTLEAYAYAVDKRNGAGMIYSSFGNAVDALCYCLGEFSELSAIATNRRKTTTIVESGETIPMTAYDQLAVHGQLQSGAIASIHYRGGMFKGTNFHWEINGSRGDFVLKADGGNPAAFPVTILASQGDGDLEVLSIPEQYLNHGLSSLSVPAQIVAQNYARVASDLHSGTHLSVTFQEAVVRHRMIDAIERSSASGSVQRYRID
ncbi:Gfo/Idh/MocA family oxidoreductase [Dyadobacter sp. CY261]|uniref:Gfo/Idh/MocA family protein n=1 Tax=Dyadobacter sp. CY261 TaxID=2907203 RepID=UPI001F25AC11|nr:Gfo/Idh/MocA family oxidoreductase [Dyadobacter sp. CY261]MCF0074226.1 Gfo/Idh/MocA family oxidoreductase [Dyadobacter sp. CY261]